MDLKLFHCKCGFGSSSKAGLNRHIGRYKSRPGEHLAVEETAGQSTGPSAAPQLPNATETKPAPDQLLPDTIADAAATAASDLAPAATQASPKKPEAELQAHPPESSWFSSQRLPALWVSPATAKSLGVNPKAAATAAGRALDSPPASSGEFIDDASLASGTPTQDADASLEAAWEAVGDQLVQASQPNPTRQDDDERSGGYAELTRALNAMTDEVDRAGSSGRDAAAAQPVHQQERPDRQDAHVPANDAVNSPGMLTYAYSAVRDSVAAAYSGAWRSSLDGLTAPVAHASGDDAAAELREGNAALEAAVKTRATGKSSWRVEDVEALLTWQNPALTAKVFGAGLYILICLRHLLIGTELLQPSTAVAGAVLAALVYNTLHTAWRHASQASSARQRPRLEAAGSKPSTATVPEALQIAQREAALQEYVASSVMAAAQRAAPLLGALVVLVSRRLSPADRLGARAWLAVVLWVAMWVGEARVISQSSLSLVAWTAAFGLPSLYLQWCHVLDALVVEGLQLISALVLQGQRATLGMAFGAAVVVVACLPLSIFTRVTLAIVAAAGVLVLRSR